MSERVENILYSPLNAFLHGMAYLPFSVLYALADVMSFLAHRVLRYRLRVVRRNLADSFPQKSVAELRSIEREFYKHLADYFVETVKLLHISDDEMRRRCIMEGVDLIDSAFEQGRSIIIYASHYANWEWLPSVTLWSRFKANEQAVFAQVYRPLNNHWFDRFFLRLRGRFHSHCFAKNTVFRDLVRARAAGKPIITGFISDQHPNVNDQGHVIRFLNHDTAMITGAEVIIRKLKYVALHFDMEKLSRGHYRVTVRNVCQDATTVPMGEITNAYARALEQRIEQAPAYWLWTHNRWKHRVTMPQSDEKETK
ncbi:MAG: lysophospholipid acyltransferase family protein [Muribaculaceae bacterium]